MRTTTRICIGMSICATLLAGCAQPARVPDSLSLKDGDGVIVYRMSCGPQVAWGEFFRSGASSTGYLAGFKRTGALLCQEGMQTQPLKAGRYFVGKIGYTGWIDIAEDAALTFTVTPGKLNYIGHIRLPSSANRDSGRSEVSIGDPVVTDKSTEAKDWLATKQPRLQRYELINALAHLPVKAGE